MPKRKVPEVQTMIDLYLAGESTNAIAEKVGVANGSVVGKWLREAGAKMRSAKEAAAVRKSSGRWSCKPAWLGKKQPAAMVEKRAAAIRGNKNGRWRDGSCREGYRSVVPKVKCAICGGQESLCIHHKDFDHYDNRVENLLVLCVSCHLSLHRQEYWDAKKHGRKPRKSNAPCHWRKSK
jgi:transposase-like protein